jgi:hypothetical protein
VAIAIGDITELVQAGTLLGRFIQVRNPSIRIPALPAFMFGTVPAQVLRMFTARTGLPPQGAWFIRDVNVAAHYLIESSGRLLKDHRSNIHASHVEQACQARNNAAVIPIHRPLSGQHVLLCGPGLPIYGHWLVEMLPKLHVLEAMQLSIQHLSFLIPSNVPNFVTRWLELLGIKGSQIVTYDQRAEVLGVEELVIPSILHNGIRVGAEFADAARTLLRRIEITRGRLKPSEFGTRIFVSRRNTGANRRLINRQEIESIAEKVALRSFVQKRFLFWSKYLSSRERDKLSAITVPGCTILCSLRPAPSSAHCEAQKRTQASSNQAWAACFGNPPDTSSGIANQMIPMMVISSTKPISVNAFV